MTYATFDSALPDPRTSPEFYDGVLTKRVFAWIIDVILIGLIAAIAVPFTAFLGLLFFPFLMLVLGFVYRWFTIAGGSSTWGMRMMAIELREADGGKMSSNSALWHTIGYSVSVTVAPLQLVSMLMMLMTDRRQGLTDTIMGTAMINRQR